MLDDKNEKGREMLIYPAQRAEGLILDLDDTVLQTTAAPRGEDGVIPGHLLTLVPGMERCLRTLPQRKVLLTQGVEYEQRDKLAYLGIEDYFERVVVTVCPFFKLFELRDILLSWAMPPGFLPQQIVVIDDRIDGIRWANYLGAVTVRMRLPGGKYSAQSPRHEIEKPDYTVENGFELMELPMLRQPAFA